MLHVRGRRAARGRRSRRGPRGRRPGSRSSRSGTRAVPAGASNWLPPCAGRSAPRMLSDFATPVAYAPVAQKRPGNWIVCGAIERLADHELDLRVPGEPDVARVARPGLAVHDRRHVALRRADLIAAQRLAPHLEEVAERERPLLGRLDVDQPVGVAGAEPRDAVLGGQRRTGRRGSSAGRSAGRCRRRPGSGAACRRRRP